MSNSRKSFSQLILHLHPSTVPKETLRFTLSYGLGGMATVLIGMLFLTGALLLLIYRPSTQEAYGSVLRLSQEVLFGRWVRNIHFWSANLLVVVTLLHFLRVVLTGTFGPGRRLNWAVGLIVLILLLGSNFTGYLLPWDQRAYWAVTISTGMLEYVPLLGPWVAKLVRGGIEIGEPTLAHFFVMHVAFLPLTLLFLVVWHFWLVRQSGGLVQRERPGPRTESVLRVPTVPDLVIREAAVGFVLVAFVLVLSILANAPLGEMANPGVSPQPAKAPWYFMGFQELLLHVHPLWAVTVWPILGVGALVGVSFWPGAVSPPGVWFGSQRGKQLAVRVAIGSVFAGVALVLFDDAILSSGSIRNVFSRGFLPLGLVLGVGYGFYRLMVRRFRYTRAEVVTAGFVCVTVLWIVLTVIGVWFRGPEMGLAWPWSF